MAYNLNGQLLKAWSPIFFLRSYKSFWRWGWVKDIHWGHQGIFLKGILGAQLPFVLLSQGEQLCSVSQYHHSLETFRPGDHGLPPVKLCTTGKLFLMISWLLPAFYCSTGVLTQTKDMYNINTPHAHKFWWKNQRVFIIVSLLIIYTHLYHMLHKMPTGKQV